MAIGTSEAYREAIYAPSRQTAALVSLDLSAPEAKDKATAGYTAQNPFSRGYQIVNNIEDNTRMATFEPDYWRLDGSYALPLLPSASAFEIGWWGAAMSDASGLLPPNTGVSVSFSEIQDIPLFALAFDERADEYIVDFNVTAYNSAGSVLLHEEVRGNTRAYAMADGGAENVARVVYTLLRTSKPFRYPRVVELDFGIKIRFDGESILDLSLSNEADPEGKSLPFPQLNVTLRNDGRFDLLDPESYAQYLQHRQPLEYRHGLYLPGGAIEWVYGGVYYLDEWSVTTEQLELTAVGIVARLDNVKHFGEGTSLMTAGQLAETILAQIGMVHEIAPVLYASPLLPAYTGVVSVRNALAMVARLSSVLTLETRNNAMRLVDAALVEPMDAIDFESTWRPPKLTLAPYYNGITLREYTERGEGGFDSTEAFYPAPWRDPLEPEYGYPLDLPMMIVNRAPDYPALRAWVLTRRFALIARRYMLDADWRQNPAQELGDTVTVGLNSKGSVLDAVTYSSSWDFTGGALRGQTKLLGGAAI